MAAANLDSVAPHAAVAAASILRPPQQACTQQPRRLVLLFFFFPLPFYALSIAYSGVPIFIPNWWPFTHYNVRYGLQLLPAFSSRCRLLAIAVLHSDSMESAAFACLHARGILLAAASYASVWRATPICLEEAQVNMRTPQSTPDRTRPLARELPPDSTLLMYLGDQVGALERAGIPLKRTINEGNHRVWKQPTIRTVSGSALSPIPSQYADYVLAFEGDPVWQAVHDLHLPELVEIHVTGQARAVLYRAR